MNGHEYGGEMCREETGTQGSGGWEVMDMRVVCVALCSQVKATKQFFSVLL